MNIDIDNTAFEIKANATLIAQNFDHLPRDEQLDARLCLEGINSALEELARKAFENSRTPSHSSTGH